MLERLESFTFYSGHARTSYSKRRTEYQPRGRKTRPKSEKMFELYSGEAIGAEVVPSNAENASDEDQLFLPLDVLCLFMEALEVQNSKKTLLEMTLANKDCCS